MKRNNAITLLAWTAVAVGVGLTSVFNSLTMNIAFLMIPAKVAPAAALGAFSTPILNQVMWLQANPSVTQTASMIAVGITIALALFVGRLAVRIWGD